MANNTTMVATVVLILAVMMAPRWTEAQPDAVCTVLLADITTDCYLTGSTKPSAECCDDLTKASDRQVTCLCDNLIAHPSTNNVTQALLELYHSGCGVADKFACKGKPSGGAANKITASVGLLGLAASLFF